MGRGSTKTVSSQRPGACLYNLLQPATSCAHSFGVLLYHTRLTAAKVLLIGFGELAAEVSASIPLCTEEITMWRSPMLQAYCQARPNFVNWYSCSNKFQCYARLPRLTSFCLCTCHANGWQVAKNIVLAGVGHVALLDGRPSQSFIGRNFLVAASTPSEQK